jgi:hypothetical protein
MQADISGSELRQDHVCISTSSYRERFCALQLELTESEINHSFPFSANVKIAWRFASTFPTPHLRIRTLEKDKKESDEGETSKIGKKGWGREKTRDIIFMSSPYLYGGTR